MGAKVHKLIDDHVISTGVDPKIAPVSLTNADFATKLAREPGDRPKASEMEHAVRAHPRASGPGPSRLPQAKRAPQRAALVSDNYLGR